MQKNLRGLTITPPGGVILKFYIATVESRDYEDGYNPNTAVSRGTRGNPADFIPVQVSNEHSIK